MISNPFDFIFIFIIHEKKKSYNCKYVCDNELHIIIIDTVRYLDLIMISEDIMNRRMKYVYT